MNSNVNLKNRQESKVPSALRLLNNWGIWKLIDGRKIPLQLSGKAAKSNDSSSWNSFEAVEELPNKIFFFPEDQTLTGIDLDDCIDSAGNYSEAAVQVLELFRGLAYAEVSPSGKGIKLIVKGKKPEGFPCKVGSVECYGSRRGFCITEQVIKGFEDIQGEAESQLLEFCNRFLRRKESGSAAAGSNGSACSGLVMRAEAYASRYQGKQEGEGRNQALFSLAGNLSALEGSNGERLSESEILPIILFANRKNLPPLEESEIKQLVSSSLRNGSARKTKPANGKPEVEIPFIDQFQEPEEPEPEEEEEIINVPKPFPIERIPEPFRSYCKQISAATCSDISFSAVPCLVLLAGLIGNSRILKVKSSWKVPAIVWGSVVAESGTGKSSPAKMIFDQLQDYQAELIRNWNREKEAYQQEFQKYEKQLNKWKKSKDDSEPPLPPERPICKRILFKDFTIEKLGQELERNPKGLIVAVDELTNWFNSFSRYSKTDDSARWLELFHASQTIIDRKNQDAPLVIDKGSVSVFGTIQPTVLRKILSEEYRGSGLAARLLFCIPDRKLKQWNDLEPVEETVQAVKRVFDEMIKQEPEITEFGKTVPEEITLSSGAATLYQKFFNRHNKEAFRKSGDILRSYAKLEEYALRFALIFEVVKAAAEGRPVRRVNTDSMIEAIDLTEYFKAESERVYSLFIGSEEDQNQKEAFQYLRRVRETTERNFFRNNQHLFENYSLSQKYLAKLVKKGLGSWEEREPNKAGGRPTRTFLVSV
jgi:hypothetical protein